MDTTWLSSNGDFCFGKYLNKFIINVSTILRKKKNGKRMFAEAHSVWPEFSAGSNSCNYCVFSSDPQK